MEILIVFLLLFFLVRWYSNNQRSQDNLKQENETLKDTIDRIFMGRDR